MNSYTYGHIAGDESVFGRTKTFRYFGPNSNKADSHARGIGYMASKTVVDTSFQVYLNFAEGPIGKMCHG